VTLAITTPRHQPAVKDGFLEASSLNRQTKFCSRFPFLRHRHNNRPLHPIRVRELLRKRRRLRPSSSTWPQIQSAAYAQIGTIGFDGQLEFEALPRYGLPEDVPAVIGLAPATLAVGGRKRRPG